MSWIIRPGSDAGVDVYQQVLWFDVPVDDVDAVQVLQGSGEIVHHGGGVPLRVFRRGGDGIEQISSLCRHQERGHAHREMSIVR